MDIERRETTITNNVYWITDNNGKRHLMNDRLAAHLIEERWKREASEKKE